MLLSISQMDVLQARYILLRHNLNSIVCLLCTIHLYTLYTSRDGLDTMPLLGEEYLWRLLAKLCVLFNYFANILGY